MKPKIIYSENYEEVIFKISDKINSIFNENQSKHILFLSSGGSCLKILNYISLENLSSNLTIGVLDERTELESNNFSQLMLERNFYTSAVEQNCKFIDIRPMNHNETRKEFAERFESLLRNWKEINPDGIIVSTIGMGPDGHISGIPVISNKDLFEKLFIETDRWVVDFNAREVGWDNPFLERATTTFNFLNEITYPLIFVTGESKRAALEKALDPKTPITELPGRFILEMKNEVYLFTDILL